MYFSSKAIPTNCNPDSCIELCSTKTHKTNLEHAVLNEAEIVFQKVGSRIQRNILETRTNLQYIKAFGTTQFGFQSTQIAPKNSKLKLHTVFAFPHKINKLYTAFCCWKSFLTNLYAII
jgi:hypothetical protein